MSKFIKIVTVLFAIAMIFGCASTGKDQKAAELPSGSIHIEEWEVLAIAETQWGHGTLGYNGKTYKFKILGFGAGGVGVHKISVTGHVYKLDKLADFSGDYFEARAGITVAEGVGGDWVKNSKGVTLHLKTHAEGVALAIGVDGLKITLE
jgi:hypothetical protein